MKIITANVNGIRAAQKKGFFDWLAREDADVICLQEIKAKTAQLDGAFFPEGLHCYYQSAQKPGYSGTALFSKVKPHATDVSPWDDINHEGRFIRADFENVSVISIYVHSGSAKVARQALKMAFLTDRLRPYLADIARTGQRVILCGDINIVHQQRDIKNFNGNKKRSGCLPEERAYLDELFGELGFVDGFRAVNQNDNEYTWWSNRGQAWANNTGWRIDYQILSPALKGTVRSAAIYKTQRFSDHAPLTLTYDL